MQWTMDKCIFVVQNDLLNIKKIYLERNESEKKHIPEPIKNFKQIFWLP